uniref:Uncharacterized protein n=1 Tax=viral metagenome TaxID=1070528 RepID=A0A6M3IVL7_9ZZZZ
MGNEFEFEYEGLNFCNILYDKRFIGYTKFHSNQDNLYIDNFHIYNEGNNLKLISKAFEFLYINLYSKTNCKTATTIFSRDNNPNFFKRLLRKVVKKYSKSCTILNSKEIIGMAFSLKKGI